MHAQTLREFMFQMQSIPGGLAFVKRASAETFDEFVEGVLTDIDSVFQDMEANPQNHCSDLEDKITYFVASMLRQKGYRTSQGTFSGGSVDLTVEGIQDGFKWTGEAKIYRALDNIQEGFLQLTTRYRPVNIQKAKAGMLLYIQRNDAKRLTQEWCDFLAAQNLPDFSVRKCPTRPDLSFYSVHNPSFSGIPMEVRHMALAIPHRPKDKSARGSKKHSSA